MCRWTVATLIAVVLAVPTVWSQNDTALTVSQKLPLSKELDGVDGWLQVMTDSRLSEKTKAEMWGVGDWSFVIPEEDPAYRLFSATPPHNAELQVVDVHGRVLIDEPLERPLARVKQARLQSAKPTFLVTVDYSIGMGSYAGPATRLLEVLDAKLRWLQATNPAESRAEPIQLARTLKSDWKFLPTGTQQDILSVYCRPQGFGDSSGFLISYVRYHFDAGRGWLIYKRVEKGIWESDEQFPSRSRFP